MSHRNSWMVRINPYPIGPNYRFRLYATPADRNIVHSYHPTIAEAINHARHLEAIAAMRNLPSHRAGAWFVEYRVESLGTEWHGFSEWFRSVPTGYLAQLKSMYPGTHRIVRRYAFPSEPEA